MVGVPGREIGIWRLRGGGPTGDSMVIDFRRSCPGLAARPVFIDNGLLPLTLEKRESEGKERRGFGLAEGTARLGDLTIDSRELGKVRSVRNGARFVF